MAGFAGVAIIAMAGYYGRTTINPKAIGPANSFFRAFFNAEAAAFAKFGKEIEFTFTAFGHYRFEFSHRYLP